MNMFRTTALSGVGLLAISTIQLFSAIPAQAALQAAPNATPPATAPATPSAGMRMGQMAPDAKAASAPRTIAPFFVPATKLPKAPNAEGFLQRWLLLEPINKPNRSNTVFVDTYVRKTLNTEYFPNQFSVVPHDGDKVTAGDQELKWHALDATNFD